MQTHELKIWTEHIEALASKRKTFEIRSTADRAFEAGPSWIEEKLFRSHDNPVIIYDHAFWSIVRSSRMYEAVEFAEIYLSKRKPDPDDPMAPCINHGGWSK